MNDTKRTYNPRTMNLSNALLEIDQESIDLVRETVTEFCSRNGRGMDSDTLSDLLVGGKKYVGVLNYVVDKYLSEVIESRKGVGGGWVPKGFKVTNTSTTPRAAGSGKDSTPSELAEETIESIAEKLHDRLSSTNGVSLTSMVLLAKLPESSIKAALLKLPDFRLVDNKTIQYAEM